MNNENKSVFSSMGVNLMLGMILFVFVSMAIIIKVRRPHDQPNFLSFYAETYAVAGPCINHNGAHQALFLKESRTGFLRGTVPITFAKEGTRIDVLYGSNGARYLKKAGDFPVREPEPE